MRSKIGLMGAALLLSMGARAVAGDVEMGKEFPNFTATDLVTGKKISLKDLRGHIVVVDYWATW